MPYKENIKPQKFILIRDDNEKYRNFFNSVIERHKRISNRKVKMSELIRQALNEYINKVNGYEK